MVKYNILSSALALLACNPLSASHESVAPPSTEKVDNPGSYRAMVYSEAFGKRFSLPAGGITAASIQVYKAVVVRVVQRTGGEPGCYLDLYVDDFPINPHVPRGWCSEGLSYRPDDEDPFFFVRRCGTPWSGVAASLGRVRSGGLPLRGMSQGTRLLHGGG